MKIDEIIAKSENEQAYWEANKALIDSAPMMLEALKAVNNYLRPIGGGDRGPIELRKLVLNAIAKAEGGKK